MTDFGLCKDTFLDIFRKGKRYEINCTLQNGHS